VVAGPAPERDAGPEAGSAVAACSIDEAGADGSLARETTGPAALVDLSLREPGGDSAST
jgi:hypothetical protein